MSNGFMASDFFLLCVFREKMTLKDKQLAVHHFLVTYGLMAGISFQGELVNIGIMMLMFEFTSFWCKAKFLLRAHDFPMNIQFFNSIMVCFIWAVFRGFYGVYVNMWIGPQIMFRAAMGASTWYFSLVPTSFQLIMFASQYMNFYWYEKWWNMMLDDYREYKKTWPQHQQKRVKTN